MRLNRAKNNITELKSLVDSWGEASTTAPEEVTKALDMVKIIYDSLRFNGDDDDVAVAPRKEVVMEVQQTLEPTPEPAPIESVEDNTPNNSTERSDEERRERRRKIKSLFGGGDDYDQPEPAAPVVETAPIVEPAPEVDPKSQPSKFGYPSIASQLTLNDRVLLSNDLFDGNMVQLNSALIALDELQTLDDTCSTSLKTIDGAVIAGRSAVTHSLLKSVLISNQGHV